MTAMDQVKLNTLVELANDPVVDDTILKIHRPYHEPEDQSEEGDIQYSVSPSTVGEDPIYDDA